MGIFSWLCGAKEKKQESPPIRRRRSSSSVAPETARVPDRFARKSERKGGEARAARPEGNNACASIYTNNGTPSFCVKLEANLLKEIGLKIGDRVAVHFLESTREIFLEHVESPTGRATYEVAVSNNDFKDMVGKIPLDARIRFQITDIPWIAHEKRKQAVVDFSIEEGGVAVIVPESFMRVEV